MENEKKQYLLLTRIVVHYTMLSMYIMQSQVEHHKMYDTDKCVFFSVAN